MSIIGNGHSTSGGPVIFGEYKPKPFVTEQPDERRHINWSAVALMIFCPPFCIAGWYAIIQYFGWVPVLSFSALFIAAAMAYPYVAKTN